MLKEIKIELTNKCSRNCKHCSSNATSEVSKLLELDFESVCKIIKEAANLGVEEVVFTGGEPLMYDSLPFLINLTHKLGMKSTIYTFAYRTEDALQSYRHLINNGLTKIVYSLADSLSTEKDYSSYSVEDFFDKVFLGNDSKLGFHYAVSKDSIGYLKDTVLKTLDTFKDKEYFDKLSLLRFVPHGKATQEMDLSKEELISIRDLYLSLEDKDKVRLGTPWNILGINNTPCIIADEIMIIGFDGIAYPCDSIKYFKELGVGGNIYDNSLLEIYNSEYFSNLRKLKDPFTCITCENYQVCKSGCIGQKIIVYHSSLNDSKNEMVLKKCASKKDPKCLR